MFVIKVADALVEIHHTYPHVAKCCTPYLSTGEADIVVSLSAEEIQAESKTELQHPGYLEYRAIHRHLAEELIDYGVFLIHGVLMEVEGRGILICARSGTGKTTHAKLWRSYLGEKCHIVNGDKPFVRLVDGHYLGYGTPWCGKEGYSENRAVEITDICFLHRGEENTIHPMAKEEAFSFLLAQVHIPTQHIERRLAVLDLLDGFHRCVKCHRLFCNMDLSAAEVAYQGIFDKNPT